MSRFFFFFNAEIKRELDLLKHLSHNTKEIENVDYWVSRTAK